MEESHSQVLGSELETPFGSMSKLISTSPLAHNQKKSVTLWNFHLGLTAPPYGTNLNQTPQKSSSKSLKIKKVKQVFKFIESLDLKRCNVSSKILVTKPYGSKQTAPNSA